MLNFNRLKKAKKNIASDLGIHIGDTLQLKFDKDLKHKYYTKLIGYLPGHSLLVTAPRQDGKLITIENDFKLSVKLLSSCSVFGFKTEVTCLISKPYPYLHLDYPFTAGEIIVRNSQRIKSKLVVLVQTENISGPATKPVSAATYDLSTSGALLESPVELGKPGDLLTLSMRINIGGSSEYMVVPAILRHIRFGKHPNNQRRLYFHGVEFQIIEQHDNIMLQGFIYQQMASESAH